MLVPNLELDPRACPVSRGLTASSDQGHPFLKWVGGKRRLLPVLSTRIPEARGRYFEPFLGGGALFFHLGADNAYLADVNADLIATYVAVRDDVDGVVAALAAHRLRHAEAYFYAVRDEWNRSTPAAGVERAAAFLYLNKACHGGVWRVGPHGFNVPWGRYTAPAWSDAILRAASRALRTAELVAASFEAVLDRARRGDFIYFDPPYNQTFSTYTAPGFGPDDHRRLADVFGELARRGCYVLLSNADTPLIRSLYCRWSVERVSARRMINRIPSGRHPVDELLINSWLPPEASLAGGWRGVSARAT